MRATPDRSTLVVRAPAKVNLTLEVVGKRPDGYHELRSVILALALHDRLAVRAAADLVIECDVPALSTTANLAWRAADALRRDAGIRQGARLALEKRIPVEAGLGGGSADAAAALVALDAFWHLDYPRERLHAIGAGIGSDVPFFLGESPLACVTGRGENLSPLTVPPAIRDARLVLLKPPVGIGAGDVYRAFPSSRWAGDHDRTGQWLAAAADAAGPADLPAPLNDMEAVALDVAPAAAAARTALLDAGAPHAIMSGSGSTYFACLDAAHAARVAGNLRANPAMPGWFLEVTAVGALPLRAGDRPYMRGRGDDMEPDRSPLHRVTASGRGHAG